MQSFQNQDPPLHFRGLSIPRLTLPESLERIWQASLKNPIRIFWVNAHSINLSEKNSSFKQTLQQAEFLLNDGLGIEIAGSVLGKPMKANLNGTDWIPAFLDFLQNRKENCSLYLLGAQGHVIAKATQIFQKRWPALSLVGWTHGYFLSPEIILKDIEAKRPTLLIVGMGVPMQEFLISENWERLKAAGIQIAIGGGAIFDFLSEEIPRAPKIFRTLRLEWLFRFLLEPRRLAKRYLWGNLYFLWLLLKEWREQN
jgi:N-acetylglucosaminyldiphosphoundecaprenol N-acetyl-beta-D-mannosaminyltransferase